MGEGSDTGDPGSGLTGTRLGGYRVREKIGEGGMGAVYLAHDAALDRRVALKTLPAELAQSETCRRRFLREARSLARVKHPSLVQIYTVAHDRGHYFFAMEYVDGENLSERVARAGPMSLDEMLAVSGQALGALAAVHDSGVVHRDVKSANIMVERTGRVVLMDLGLAKDEATAGLTTAGMILGTPAYMSPEQARGEEATLRSDIYSFGVVLYEMATGRLPFTGKSAIAVLNKHVTEEPLPVPASRPDLPPAFSAAVAAAMAKDAKERAADARALAALLLRAGRTPELETVAGAGPSGAVLSSGSALALGNSPDPTAPTLVEGREGREGAGAGGGVIAVAPPVPQGTTAPTMRHGASEAAPGARDATEVYSRPGDEGREETLLGRWWPLLLLCAILAVTAGIIVGTWPSGPPPVETDPEADAGAVRAKPSGTVDPAPKATRWVLRTAGGAELVPGRKVRLVEVTGAHIVVELEDGTRRTVPFSRKPVLERDGVDADGDGDGDGVPP